MRTLLSFLLLGIASAGLAACGSASSTEGGVGSSEEAWSSASCATTTPNSTFTGNIDPEYIAPAGYNRCTKSSVIDLISLDANHAGPGSGGGADATIYVTFEDTFTNTQAGCEDLEGGAIFYKKVGSSWVDQTGQLYSTGTWTPAPFGGFFCSKPGAQFTGLVAGQSYRIAATMRQISGGNPTRKVGYYTAPPTNIR